MHTRSVTGKRADRQHLKLEGDIFDCGRSEPMAPYIFMVLGILMLLVSPDLHDVLGDIWQFLPTGIGCDLWGVCW